MDSDSYTPQSDRVRAPPGVYPTPGPFLVALLANSLLNIWTQLRVSMCPNHQDWASVLQPLGFGFKFKIVYLGILPFSASDVHVCFLLWVSILHLSIPKIQLSIFYTSE